MLHKTLTTLALCAALGILGACVGEEGRGAAVQPGQHLRITEDAWADYLEYRQLIGGQRTGAFLMAMRNDVGVAGVYSYCQKGADRCRSRSSAGPINHAYDTCKQHGLDCILFARNAEIVASYEIVH